MNHVCGHGEWGFNYLASIASARGLLCCWDKTVFEALKCVSEPRFVVIRGQWVDGIGPEGLICIYAPNEVNEISVCYMVGLLESSYFWRF